MPSTDWRSRECVPNKCRAQLGWHSLTKAQCHQEWKRQDERRQEPVTCPQINSPEASAQGTKHYRATKLRLKHSSMKPLKAVICQPHTCRLQRTPATYTAHPVHHHHHITDASHSSCRPLRA